MATTKALELAQLADGIDVNANGEITNIGTLSSLDISGDISTSTLSASANVAIADDAVINIGSGNDLRLYHRSSDGHSFIDEVGSGSLYIRAEDRINFRNRDGSVTTANFIASGGVELYYAGDKKFQTSNTGISVVGDVNANTLTTSGNASVGNDLTVAGNFTVSGNTTFVNTDNLEIEDLNITLASGAANSAVADGAGITVDGANATLTYDAGGDRWKLNRSLYTTAAGNNALILESVSGGSSVQFNTGSGTLNSYIMGGVGGTANLRFKTNGDNDRLIIQDNGDIQFYEDNGGTPQVGMHWDYTDGHFGIGTSTPIQLLHVNSVTPISGSIGQVDMVWSKFGGYHVTTLDKSYVVDIETQKELFQVIHSGASGDYFVIEIEANIGNTASGAGNSGSTRIKLHMNRQNGNALTWDWTEIDSLGQAYDSGFFEPYLNATADGVVIGASSNSSSSSARLEVSNITFKVLSTDINKLKVINEDTVVTGKSIVTGTVRKTESNNEFRNNANDPIITMLDSGNVGINQISPSQKLHIGDGNDTDRGIVAIEGAGGQHLIFSEASAHPYGANAFALRPASGTNFIIQSDGSSVPALTVDTSGNVGIGEDEPTSKLHVVGKGYFYVGQDNGISISKDEDTSSDWYTNGQAAILVNNRNANGSAILKLENEIGRIVYGNASDGDSLIFSSRQTETATSEQIIFDNNGNIGLGSHPGTTIDINAGERSVLGYRHRVSSSSSGSGAYTSYQSVFDRNNNTSIHSGDTIAYSALFSTGGTTAATNSGDYYGLKVNRSLGSNGLHSGDFYGVHINTAVYGRSSGTNYGVYIADVGTDNSSGSKYGIYSVSPDVQSNHAGRVVIGSSGVGSQQLTVQGQEADIWLTNTNAENAGSIRLLASTSANKRIFRIYDNEGNGDQFTVDPINQKVGIGLESVATLYTKLNVNGGILSQSSDGYVWAASSGNSNATGGSLRMGKSNDNFSQTDTGWVGFRAYHDSDDDVQGIKVVTKNNASNSAGNTETIDITPSGDILPEADASQDLGSPTQRWDNVYTTDMHFSNVGKEGGNDVDGTTGNWTLQEGADAIYMINNVTGKKYSIMLKEVE